MFPLVIGGVLLLALLGSSGAATPAPDPIKPDPTPPPPPPKPTSTSTSSTILFDPARPAKDPVRARNIAIAIANSPDPRKSPAGTFDTLADFAAYPGNSAAIVAFQDSASLTVDGRYGQQTQRAFDYYLSVAGRPA